MFPEIVSIGPASLRSLSVLTAVAFITICFLFWRKGKEEHYELSELFDVFFVSWIFGFLAGRAAYISLHQDLFGMQVGKWFDIITYPGFTGLVAIVVAGVYLYVRARKNEWDSFELLDFFSLAVVNGMVLMYIGQFLDGAGMGHATQLPMGVLFPGMQEAHHPTQLYLAASFFIVARLLSKFEYRYRSFSWYRAGKKTAQTGFLTSVFLLSSGLILFVASMLKPAVFMVSGIGFDPLIAGVLFCTGAWMLFVRSGRSLQKRKAAPYAA